MFLEMVNYGWRMANGQLLHIFNSVHSYFCYCTFIILVFILCHVVLSKILVSSKPQKQP